MTDPDTFDPNAPTDDLIAFALSHPPTEEWTTRDEVIVVLHRRGTREVFDAATRLLTSACAAERALGVRVHSQLGYEQDKPFAAESVRLLSALLETEKDEEVVRAVLFAFPHLNEPECVSVAVRFADHYDPDIRYAATHALTGQDDERAIACLIGLTTDADVRVRDWATFALGTQTDWDSPELRAALWARLSDSDNETRGEALKGLAKRRDDRAAAAIMAELGGPDPHEYAVAAADELADARLVPALEALQLRWPGQSWLEGAIKACRAGT